LAFRIKILPQNLEINAQKGELLIEVLHRLGIFLEAECGGQGTCGKCVVQIVEGFCEGQGSELLTEQQVSEGFVLSCQVEVNDNLVVIAHESVPHIHETVDSASSKFEIDIPQEIEIQPLSKKLERKDRKTKHYGIACDVGTTTVALNLVDLITGKILTSRSSYNNQIRCGADIISRIIYSQKPGHLEELNRLIIGTINQLLNSVLSTIGISREDITSAAFSGNATMTHLLLGIDPKNIRLEPYVPTVQTVPLHSAKEIGIHIHPEAVVYFTPAVGSYVGGDITSGILCTKLKGKSPGIELFIDVGTNGELVVMGDDWMIGCACSAGPAFEGVGIDCGMRASIGAIDSVDINITNQEIKNSVIGNVKPLGICGSGIIELVAGLFEKGMIDRNGKFTDVAFKDRIRCEDNRCYFILVSANQTATGNDIFISEKDIANVMRAKAAIYSACSLLLKNVGLKVNDIEKIYVAGGFGSHLNFRHAITIGMLPDIDLDKFEYLGNTSLIGAQLALLSEEFREQLAQIAKSITYVDLSSEPNYMDMYTAALFLPHTDIELFPTVKKTLLSKYQPPFYSPLQ
jgi:uncharacterized 2Fe-2S/4Fe-4S cluster protein (DUF4445 family)